MHQKKSSCVSPVQSPSPPNSVQEVANSVQSMDKRFGTTFESWIKSEKNISYICTFKRSLFDRYIKTDPQQTIYALKWMIEGWSIASVSEVVLKLYYAMKIDSPEFGRIVGAVVDEWNIPEIIGLVNVLLIGENADTAAKFIVYLTDQCRQTSIKSTLNVSVKRDWRSSDRVQLVREVATTLRWKTTFLQSFLACYVSQCISDSDRQKGIMDSVIQEFDDLQAIATFNQFARQLACNANISLDKIPTSNNLSTNDSIEYVENVGISHTDRDSDEDSNSTFIADRGSTLDPPVSQHIQDCPTLDNRFTHDRSHNVLQPTVQQPLAKSPTFQPSTHDLTLPSPPECAPISFMSPLDSLRSRRSQSRIALFTMLFEIVLAEIELDELEKSMTQLGRGMLVHMVANALQQHAESDVKA
ncbi:expressed protein [Batrachochytrium dendrobatidis JAM81]|uniref:Expressed protein n=1 Tax=Batrachochytrium dendrobatidis (strain JAM81 / FGSC 10211) TaxID=684364 RepID=F4P8N9_BATDJ|nr:uncharacterized protein BATDEDRAFT_90835 [Batrachochytrium dendrobatidis JAM81]EGF78178.1 expressed protein [Batrachochytrium dendrobatidis JAM81]|eukprot:XP_006681224.1 expressed protein [Batrachochytrium dendrobatidis JAM81]